MNLVFTKMHGAGNDFVILDCRHGQALPDQATLTRMADRRFGIGCDQIMVLEPPRRAGSLAAYRIINNDGSLAGQCGNGARCLAAWLQRAGELGVGAVLDSPSGPVPARPLADGSIEITLSVPAFEPEAIPLHLPVDCGAVAAGAGAGGGQELKIDGQVVRFGAVSMGNPHVIIEVANLAQAPLALAARLQADPAFPQGCNVSFARVIDGGRIGLRVIERGVGETLACGSAACASHAWLHRQGRVGERSQVELPGGILQVRWAGGDDEPVRLAGPSTFVFEGTWPI
ncbi:MAG: diaminopimelate epimerase [Xanthomonadales bacterium]|nr:diaminopimelate epimerase [Xanthomonadales bacterium]